MSLFATAGTKLSIGPAIEDKNEDFLLADLSALTPYVPITSMESMGTLGDTSQSITFDAIDQARTKILKGTRSAGTMELVCGVEAADAGQLALIAAERTPYYYAFKVELNDKPKTGSSPKNSVRYFAALVMSQQEVYDGANNVRKINFTLGINSNIVRVAASAT